MPHERSQPFYRNREKLMVVDIQTAPEFHAGTPKLLFEGRYAINWDVHPDRTRFLMIKPAAPQQRSVEEINIVLNWFEELRRQMPPK